MGLGVKTFDKLCACDAIKFLNPKLKSQCLQLAISIASFIISVTGNSVLHLETSAF